MKLYMYFFMKIYASDTVQKHTGIGTKFLLPRESNFSNFLINLEVSQHRIMKPSKLSFLTANGLQK